MPINILMCGSVFSVKGGMISVVKNYLEYDNWDNYNIIYVSTHIEKNKCFLILYFGLAYLRILFLVMTKHIQIAHLHTAERGSFYRKAFLVRAFNFFGVKTIMHHHAAEFELFYNGLSEKRKKYVKHILETVDLNLVLSRNLISSITDKAPGAKVEVLYNAVPVLDVNPYNKKAKNILFLGRLGERKGTYDLLKVVNAIDLDIDKNICFYLCGDGEIDEVKRKVKELKIGHRIAHIGWIDGKQKELYKLKTIIHVLPSYNEGLPMSILETMAYGIPSISTNVASIPEILKDSENGFLIEPGDTNALKFRLKELIDNEALRTKFSNKSYKLIRNQFSLNSNMKKLIYIYSKLQGQKTKS